jgi:SAM-dependent methyltransferase
VNTDPESSPALLERDRIRLEYERRDRDQSLRQQFRLTEPPFLFHMQEREWALLSLLRREALDLQAYRVLEVGCGSGHILQRFLDFGAAEAIGVDLMSNRIRSARKEFPNVKAAVADGTMLPFPNASFDLVMQFMCISSVLPSAVRERIGHEMWRVVKPGGAILSYDMRTMPKLPGVLARVMRMALMPLRLWRRRGGSRAAGGVHPPVVTPIVPLDREEIRRLYAGECQLTATSLNGTLARLAVRGRWLPLLLSAFPFLRSHYIALIRKPGPTPMREANS